MQAENFNLEKSCRQGYVKGPVLFQFPKSFRADGPALRDFIDIVPAKTFCAFEFRNRSRLNDDTLHLLHEKGHSLCIADTKDRFAGAASVLKDGRSVVSGKTLEDISRTGKDTPFKRKKVRQIRRREAVEGVDLSGAPVKPMPHHIAPMLAASVKEPFDHPDWIFEMKWDGYRAIAEIRDGDVSLYSRNQKSFNRKYPPHRGLSEENRI